MYQRYITVDIDVALEQDEGRGRVVADGLDAKLEKAVQAFYEALDVYPLKGHIESVRYRSTFGYRRYAKTKTLGGARVVRRRRTVDA